MQSHTFEAVWFFYGLQYLSVWEKKEGKEERRMEEERIQYADPDHPDSVAFRPLFPPCRKLMQIFAINS